MLRPSRPLSLLAVISLVVSFHLSAETVHRRASIVSAGVTVEYDPKDEAFVRAFCTHLPELKRLQQALKGAEPTRGDEIDFDTLRAKRDEFLAIEAWYLGLKAPTPKMRKVFEGMRRTFVDQLAQLRRTWSTAMQFNSVQVWRKADLVAELRAHRRNDYFRLDENSGDPVACNGWTVHFSGTRGTLKFVGTARHNVFLPVILDDADVAKPDARVARHVARASDQIRQFANSLPDSLRAMEIMIVLHEPVEVAIIDTYVASGDRRWFCDGMANFIAYRALVEVTTPAEARRHFDLHRQLAQWTRYLAEADLPRWKAAENQSPEEKDSEFDHARYAFATKVMSDIYEKHGREIFPRWFRQIARTPKAQTTMVTIGAAFTELTGERLEAYFPRPLFPPS